MYVAYGLLGPYPPPSWPFSWAHCHNPEQVGNSRGYCKHRDIVASWIAGGRRTCSCCVAHLTWCGVASPGEGELPPYPALSHCGVCVPDLNPPPPPTIYVSRPLLGTGMERLGKTWVLVGGGWQGWRWTVHKPRSLPPGTCCTFSSDFTHRIHIQRLNY